MPDLLKDELIQTSLFSVLCEAGKFDPYVHPDETLMVTTPCAGRGRKNIVTCQDEGRDEDVEEVGGLDMLGVKLLTTGVRLPEFIPIVPRGMFNCSGVKIPSKTVGIVIDDILTTKIKSKSGRLRFPTGTKINQAVLSNHAFQGKRVILFSTGPDVLIETLWWQREQRDFFRVVAGMGFSAITGMNFSVFIGECPFAHALNIKKSVRYCKEFDKLGVWAIPHVYAINSHQRQRWKWWLLANPRVKIVTINAQLQRRQKGGMNEVFKTTRFLLESTNVEIIIHGGPQGFADMRKTFGKRLHFAASGPLKNAAIRKDKTARQYVHAYRNRIRAFTLP